MNDDQGSEGWAEFFGVMATGVVGLALLLAVGVGILLGYYVIGSGGSGSSHKSVVAQAAAAGAAPATSASGTPPANSPTFRRTSA